MLGGMLNLESRFIGEVILVDLFQEGREITEMPLFEKGEEITKVLLSKKRDMTKMTLFENWEMTKVTLFEKGKNMLSRYFWRNKKRPFPRKGKIC